jgi:hypothetical protein
MTSMFNPDSPAKCCSYCGGRDHEFEECPKRKADAEKEEAAREPEPEVVSFPYSLDVSSNQ